jgi:hypothetical protein
MFKSNLKGFWAKCFYHGSSGKILNRPKELNAVSAKVLLRFFPSVCPFAPSIFSQVPLKSLKRGRLTECLSLIFVVMVYLTCPTHLTSASIHASG